ncbi:MAG TPA: (deoxy)nucleoside triphosphate pyrophosphohydrolase [Candidatus Acidoferrales bacterium]|nr:(deoxy)nucleoside triphosphate pyrophosphohydrolase [Candidatus Acidoferrales bacterium]
MVQVVAAIVERDGRILICRRTAEQSHALQWEFPGGKVEPGETPPQALERELAEELGIRHAAGVEITRYQYTYPGRSPILLIFFRIMGFEGEPTNLIFHEMRWEPPERLAAFDFVEGDGNFIRTLSG